MKKNNISQYVNYSSNMFYTHIVDILDKEGITYQVSLLEHNSLSINIDNAQLSDVLNLLLILYYYEKVEVSHVKIHKKVNENGDYIIGAIISLNKLAKRIE
ncbi:hypothetical protein [Yersinia pekkanenii]|nr:hypothetical protein [Yersinia pekkanenii]